MRGKFNTLIHVMFGLIFLCSFNALSFEGTTSLNFGSILKPSLSTFDNFYSRMQTSTTLFQFRTVKCERVSVEGVMNSIDRVRLLSLKGDSYHQIERLVSSLDDLQFKLCNEMVEDGASAEFVVKIGELWQITLSTGSSLQHEFHYLISSEEEIEEQVRDYIDEFFEIYHSAESERSNRATKN